MSLSLDLVAPFFDGGSQGEYHIDGVVSGDSMSWDWGDGTSPDTTTVDANGPYNVHTYAVAGTYTLTVTVTGPDAGSVSTDPDGVVVNCNPFFTGAPTTIGAPWEAGQEFTFTPDMPDPADGRTYHWDFGDGNTQDPGDGIGTNTFADGGTFTITFDVHPPSGLVPPLDDPSEGSGNYDIDDVDSFWGWDDTAIPSIDFSAENQIGDNATDWTYEWDFGDGSPHDTTSGANATHVYATQSTFTVILTVVRLSDSHTSSTSDTVVTIPPPGPNSDFTMTPGSGDAPLEVVFTNTGASDQDYSWDFGDGSSVDTSGPRVVHTFDTPGEYAVALTVTNDDPSFSVDHTTTTRTITIGTAPTTLGVRTDPLLALAGNPVDLVVTVGGGVGAATGSVTVSIDDVELGVVTITAGTGSISWTPPADDGTYTVHAVYGGDENHDGLTVDVLVPVHGPGLMAIDGFDPSWEGARAVALDGGSTPTGRIQANDVGSMTVQVGRAQEAAVALGYRSRLRMMYRGTPAILTRHLEGINDTVIGQGDRTAKVLQLTARGVGAELEESCVEPEGGMTLKPFYPTRYLDWRSADLDRSGWTPTVFPLWPPDSGVVGIYGRQYPPNGFPAPFAGWTWSEAEDDTYHQQPVGHVYGAKSFFLTDEVITDLWAAADDTFEMALNGKPWLKGDDFPNGSWELPYARRGTVSGGYCLLTWHAQNYDLGWANNELNIAGLVYAMFHLDATNTGTISYANLLFESGPNPNPLLSDSFPDAPPLPDGAVWLGYPDNPPGFTPGHVMVLLLREAQARGELTDWVFSFDAINDSAGNAWSGTAPYAFEVGSTTYLDVVKQLIQDDVDVVWGPDMPPTMHMFNKGTVPSSIEHPNYPAPGALALTGAQLSSTPNLSSWVFDGQG